MNKKGVELSFNIIVILIILVIVLVIIAAFFTGAFSKLLERLNQVNADSLSIAVSDCNSKCKLAQTYDTTNAKKKSGYCKNTWRFDVDEDGQVDKVGDDFREYHCWEVPIEEDCTGVRQHCGEAGF